MGIARTARLGPESSPEVHAPDVIEREALLDQARRLGLRLGDVLVSDVPGGPTELTAVRAAIVGTDVPVRRDDVIDDVYTSSFGDRLLSIGGGPRSHHTQLRRYDLWGTPILQVAAYPEPPSTSGVRLWCAPAMVWLFVATPRSGEFDEALQALQPHWERLLAHHGVPLDRPLDPELERRYPVPNRIVPLDGAQLAELRGAVDLLVGQEPIAALVDETASPRAAVDVTLQARRVLLRHMDRLDTVLEHSHGAARDKYRAMERLAEEIGAGTVHLGHLLAPHRHLVDGLDETRQHVARAVDAATETTSLITSAAVGRLLDRSEANRRVTTAVGAAAFLLALVANYSALAAVPRDDRVLRSFVQIGAWLAVGAIGLLVGAYVLARLSAMPSRTVPRRLAALLRAGAPCAGIAATALFVWAGVTASVPALAAGAVCAVVLVVIRAVLGDY